MSVAVPAGFAVAGVAAGVKADDALDLAMVVAQAGTVGAAVFTTNSAAAAPVRLSRKHLAVSRAVRAVVLNSGGANAATGAAGDETAAAMAAEAATAIGCDVTEILVCSTGTIGTQLPRDRVLAGIRSACGGLASGTDASERAARAIMTTDSVPKQAGLASPAGWSIGAIAKGAGMIRPDMATMLAVLTTDARVAPDVLDGALQAAVDRSFHELNVDGCSSTNDTVIALASGASDVEPTVTEFAAALETVCRDLAQQLAADAEGASRVVVINLTGAADDASARHLGRAIADSALVRAAFYGGDPNWGRIVGALGTVAPADVVDQVDIAFEGVPVARGGVAVSCDEDALAARMASGDFRVDVRVGSGPGVARILTTDLTPEYVRFNGERS